MIPTVQSDQDSPIFHARRRQTRKTLFRTKGLTHSSLTFLTPLMGTKIRSKKSLKAYEYTKPTHLTRNRSPAREGNLKLTSMRLHSFVSITIVSFGFVSGFVPNQPRTKISLQNSSRNPCDACNRKHAQTVARIPLYARAEDDESSIVSRFLDPRIDDAGLPLADALIAQIVAPTLEIFWLSSQHAPIPSWLTPIFDSSKSLLFSSSARGSLLAPALIHGAGLATCWTLGALAAKGYESDAFNISGDRGYGTVIKRIVQAGAFATGLLIFSTQVDLFAEFGRNVQLGESDETDLRLITALVEMINDIVFEAGALSAWRLYRASLTGDASGRPPNYEP